MERAPKLLRPEEIAAKVAEYERLKERIRGGLPYWQPPHIPTIRAEGDLSLWDAWIRGAESTIEKRRQEVRDHPEWFPRRDWVIEADGFPRKRRTAEKGVDQLREEEEEHRKMLDDQYEYDRRYGRQEAGELPKEE